MTDRDALLRSVCENPDDDVPRLVFADWLEENGEPERAEFIRLQCMISGFAGRTEQSPDQLAVNAARVRQLKEAHQGDWLAELPRLSDVSWYPLFYRGFVARVDVRYPETLLAHESAIFRATPVSHCLVRWIYPTVQQPLVGVEQLANVPSVARLRYLSLNYHKISPSQLLVELRFLQDAKLHHRLHLHLRVPRFTSDSRVERMLQDLTRESKRREHRFTFLFHYDE